MKKKTLVIGASEKPERYSNKAIKALRNHDHPVVALAPRAGRVDDVVFTTEMEGIADIDTVTMYVGPQNQSGYIDFILGLKPQRVIFNPGTENEPFAYKLQENGIQPEIACTLVLLSLGEY